MPVYIHHLHWLRTLYGRQCIYIIYTDGILYTAASVYISFTLTMHFIQPPMYMIFPLAVYFIQPPVYIHPLHWRSTLYSRQCIWYFHWRHTLYSRQCIYILYTDGTLYTAASVYDISTGGLLNIAASVNASFTLTVLLSEPPVYIYLHCRFVKAGCLFFHWRAVTETNSINFCVPPP
jgi:hypothetical protein